MGTSRRSCASEDACRDHARGPSPAVARSRPDPRAASRAADPDAPGARPAAASAGARARAAQPGRPARPGAADLASVASSARGGEPVEQGHGVRRPGQADDLRCNALGRDSVAGVCQDGEDRLANRLGGGAKRIEPAPHAERFASGGVVRLVAAHRQHNRRQARRKGTDHGAGTAVADHEIAVGEHDRLRDVRCDEHPRPLRAEAARIELRPHGRDHVDLKLAQPAQDPREQVA
jgi:hypothetical protein